MSDGFQEGDVVRLKSGGPDMTVTEKNTHGELICEWFDDGEAKARRFSEKALEQVDPNDD